MRTVVRDIRWNRYSKTDQYEVIVWATLDGIQYNLSNKHSES